MTINMTTGDTVIAHFRPIGTPPTNPPLPGDIGVPTAFSPNGDGNNDQLFVLGNNFNAFTLSVYNRWGQKVFETSKRTEGWDGSFKGQPANQGVYAYKLYYKLDTGEEGFTSGNVTLVR
jgi:gliding motility-associated-like protein